MLVKSDDNNIREVIKSASCNIETYGYDEAAEWRIESYRFEKGFGHFSLAFKNQHRGDFELAMIGRHNVENAAAVAGLCFNLGLTKDEINEGFRTFKGVKRRQEIVGEKQRLIIVVPAQEERLIIFLIVILIALKHVLVGHILITVMYVQ